MDIINTPIIADSIKTFLVEAIMFRKDDSYTEQCFTEEFRRDQVRSLMEEADFTKIILVFVKNSECGNYWVFEDGNHISAYDISPYLGDPYNKNPAWLDEWPGEIWEERWIEIWPSKEKMEEFEQRGLVDFVEPERKKSLTKIR